MTLGSADVIVVAAGEGRRMGGGPNKLLRPLAGRPLLGYTLAPFQAAPEVGRIVIVLREDDRTAIDALVQENGITKAAGHYASGGACRADSVRSGLDFLEIADPPEWVLVQDGARPFTRSSMIRDSLQAAARTGAAVVATPVQDTVKESDGGGLAIRTLDRRQLWHVQTPQTFRFALLCEAYQRLPVGDHSRWTDDAMVLEAQGISSAIVPGDVTNLKVTTPDDFAWAEFLLEHNSELLQRC